MILESIATRTLALPLHLLSLLIAIVLLELKRLLLFLISQKTFHHFFNDFYVIFIDIEDNYWWMLFVDK